jgi:hypothetical protein
MYCRNRERNVGPVANQDKIGIGIYHGINIQTPQTTPRAKAWKEVSGGVVMLWLFLFLSFLGVAVFPVAVPSFRRSLDGWFVESDWSGSLFGSIFDLYFWQPPPPSTICLTTVCRVWHDDEREPQ